MRRVADSLVSAVDFGEGGDERRASPYDEESCEICLSERPRSKGETMVSRDEMEKDSSSREAYPFHGSFPRAGMLKERSNTSSHMHRQNRVDNESVLDEADWANLQQ